MLSSKAMCVQEYFTIQFAAILHPVLRRKPVVGNAAAWQCFISVFKQTNKEEGR